MACLVKLTARARQSVSDALTEAGRTFLKEARSGQRAVQLTQAASRGEAGQLDIAYTVEAFEAVLLRVMRRFRQLFPMMELEI